MNDRTRVLAAVAFCASVPALAAPVGFDQYAEGGHGETATFDGITFRDINTVSGVNPDGLPFDPEDVGTHTIVERMDYLCNDFPDVFSPLNGLTFGNTYIPGPNLSIGPLSTATFGSGATLKRAEWDIGFYTSGPWTGIELRTEALLAGAVVATSTYVVPGDPDERDYPDTLHMSIEAAAFDAVRLSAWLGGVPTTLRVMMDNVELTEGGCAADLDGSGEADVNDLLAYLGLFRVQDANADFDGDGGVNVNDLLGFLGAFRAGC